VARGCRIVSEYVFVKSLAITRTGLYEAVYAPVSVDERLLRITPEWRAWQRHLGRSIPVDKRGGWHFPSKLPPLTEAEA
jgi:hypothetical protein